jgi:NDP-sugar pyrophosphorylase family protein
MNILIPMAGAGSRFTQLGYKDPKPLIKIRGKTMINMVIDNLNVPAKFTFVVKEEQCRDYNLDNELRMKCPGCNIIKIDRLTEGAACTTLLARDIINTDEDMLIANCDQFIEWNPADYINKAKESDGCILTFPNNSTKCSYAKVSLEGLVTEVREKIVISNDATVGLYYWKKGSEYVKYAEQMIAKNIRTNNEFYTAPVYNEAIADGKKITIFGVEKVWGTGTPEDLEFFISNYKGNI